MSPALRTRGRAACVMNPCERLPGEPQNAMRLPGLSWMELLDRVRQHVGEFIVLTGGRKPDIARALLGSIKVLEQPVQKSDLDRLLAAVEERANT